MIKNIFTLTLIFIVQWVSIDAQELVFNRPSWWFGAVGAGNLNFYQGSTQQLTSRFSTPVPFTKGFGAGPYLAVTIEHYRPNTMLGFMLQGGYDNRMASFDPITTEQGHPTDLSTWLHYVTIEPSLRFAPFRSNFYLYGGPRFAFNTGRSFTYKQGISPAFPNDALQPDLKGDFSNIQKTIVSMQVGAGYDLFASARNQRTQYIISPFVAFHPTFGQAPRSTESWDVSTLRAGVALKIGCSKPGNIRSSFGVLTPPVVDKIPDVQFTVLVPKNLPVIRRVREIFPLRNYIFFDIGSTEIPSRYKFLRRGEVKNFKEDQLDVRSPKTLSGRSDREMEVYYNVLNILGDRMQKSPSTTIKLVGSSELGPQDGRLLSLSVQKYLNEIFDIEVSRMVVEGRAKPKIPSEQTGATRELELLRAGDRRVSIESTSPILLMEFQSGPNTALKPVIIEVTQEAPLESYITVQAIGARAAFSSWYLEIEDKQGNIKKMGPFTNDRTRIPGKLILGTLSEGTYTMTMIGQMPNGRTMRKATEIHMTLWTPPENEQGTRYNILYEFNDAKAIKLYENYLREIVAPSIPKDAMVIVHGYTDIIGDATYNQTLSEARANDVKSILESSLAKVGRSDVKFEVFGLGEDEGLVPFDNTYPEGRFYNRTVLIDIFPR